MATLPIIQSVVFGLYLLLTLSKFSSLLKFGQLHSISNTWYLLPYKLKPLFTAFCWGIGIPFFFYGHWIFFLAGAGFVFVGAATAFKSDNIRTDLVHYLAAALGILLTAIGLGINLTWIPAILIAVATVGLMGMRVKNEIFWVEVVAFLILMPFLFGMFLN